MTKQLGATGGRKSPQGSSVRRQVGHLHKCKGWVNAYPDRADWTGGLAPHWNFFVPDQQQISNKRQVSHNWIIHHQWAHLFWVIGRLISKNVTEMTSRQAAGRFMLELFRTKPLPIYCLVEMLFHLIKRKSKWSGASWATTRCDHGGLGGHSGVSAGEREPTYIPFLPQFHSKCQSSSRFSGASNPAWRG